jgi:hypothetical protein
VQGRCKDFFIDESGLLLMPTRRRTWAPEGHTPIFRSNDEHDRISALAAITVEHSVWGSN